jgi:hypothetical protein
MLWAQYQAMPNADSSIPRAITDENRAAFTQTQRWPFNATTNGTSDGADRASNGRRFRGLERNRTPADIISNFDEFWHDILETFPFEEPKQKYFVLELQNVSISAEPRLIQYVFERADGVTECLAEAATLGLKHLGQNRMVAENIHLPIAKASSYFGPFARFEDVMRQLKMVVIDPVTGLETDRCSNKNEFLPINGFWAMI